MDIVDVRRTQDKTILDYWKTVQNNGMYEDAFVCLINNEIIGHAYISENYYHPYSKSLAIVLKTEIESRYLELVRTIQNKTRDSLRIGFDSEKHALRNALESGGFKHVTTSHLPVINCEEPGISDDVIYLKDASSHQVAEFKKLHYLHYMEDHQYNPLNESIGHHEFFEATSKDYSDKYSFMIWENNEVYVGYLVFEDEEVAEVGYFFTKDDVLTKHNLEVCLKAIKGINCSEISFEIDDVNKSGMSLINALKVRDYELWDVYMSRESNKE